jgi:hypothetical protein
MEMAGHSSGKATHTGPSATNHSRVVDVFAPAANAPTTPKTIKTPTKAIAAVMPTPD